MLSAECDRVIEFALVAALKYPIENREPQNFCREFLRRFQVRSKDEPCYRIGIYAFANLLRALDTLHTPFIILWKTIVQNPFLQLEPKWLVVDLTNQIIRRADLPLHYFNGPHYMYAPESEDEEESESEQSRYFRPFFRVTPLILSLLQ
jgi:hypothetical protein